MGAERIRPERSYTDNVKGSLDRSLDNVEGIYAAAEVVESLVRAISEDRRELAHSLHTNSGMTKDRARIREDFARQIAEDLGFGPAIDTFLKQSHPDAPWRIHLRENQRLGAGRIPAINAAILATLVGKEVTTDMRLFYEDGDEMKAIPGETVDEVLKRWRGIVYFDSDEQAEEDLELEKATEEANPEIESKEHHGRVRNALSRLAIWHSDPVQT